jgi:hypothetical protein
MRRFPPNAMKKMLEESIRDRRSRQVGRLVPPSGAAFGKAGECPGGACQNGARNHAATVGQVARQYTD